MRNREILPLCAIVLLGIAGCVRSAPEPQASAVQVIKAPGVVEEIWEEPITDVVDVPPGLDPEGHYYRPGHQEVVEVRQGRWKYHRPNNGGK